MALSTKKVRRAAEAKRGQRSLYDDDKFADALKIKMKPRKRGLFTIGKKFPLFRRCVPLDFLYGGIDRVPNADKIIPIVQRKKATKSTEPVVVSKYIAHNEKTGKIIGVYFVLVNFGLL